MQLTTTQVTKSQSNSNAGTKKAQETGAGYLVSTQGSFIDGIRDAFYGKDGLAVGDGSRSTKNGDENLVASINGRYENDFEIGLEYYGNEDKNTPENGFDSFTVRFALANRF